MEQLYISTGLNSIRDPTARDSLLRITTWGVAINNSVSRLTADVLNLTILSDLKHRPNILDMGYVHPRPKP
jgi:hypothetical protein